LDAGPERINRETTLQTVIKDPADEAVAEAPYPDSVGRPKAKKSIARAMQGE
jgi:hypothetical protein